MKEVEWDELFPKFFEGWEGTNRRQTQYTFSVPEGGICVKVPVTEERAAFAVRPIQMRSGAGGKYSLMYGINDHPNMESPWIVKRKGSRRSQITIGFNYDVRGIEQSFSSDDDVYLFFDFPNNTDKRVPAGVMLMLLPAQ